MSHPNIKVETLNITVHSVDGDGVDKKNNRTSKSMQAIFKNNYIKNRQIFITVGVTYLNYFEARGK